MSLTQFYRNGIKARDFLDKARSITDRSKVAYENGEDLLSIELSDQAAEARKGLHSLPRPTTKLEVLAYILGGGFYSALLPDPR